MTQQTAVKWLFEKCMKINFHEDLLHEERLEFLEDAKETEKEQHGQTWDAAIKAHDDRGHVHARSLTDFDEYYNEKFNK